MIQARGWALLSESARNLVSAILNNEDIINTLATACAGQRNVVNQTQYRSTEEEMHSLFHRGRPSNVNVAAGQTVPIHTDRNMPNFTPAST